MRYSYPCILTPEPEGGFFVQFPDVRGALSNGADREEALEMAEDALAVALGGYVASGWDIPKPSPASDGQELVAVPPVVAAKLSLYTAMREQGITKADLAEQLGLNETAAAKLVNPDYGSPISSVLKALRVVGRSLVVEDLAAQPTRRRFDVLARNLVS